MKIPKNTEEYLAWPPMGGIAGFFVGTTLYDVITKYHSLLQGQEEYHYSTGYLFPVFMGVGLASTLHGKYWLGFGWLSFLVYLAALILQLFNLQGILASTYIVITCLALMFAVQSLILYLKRVTIHNAST